MPKNKRRKAKSKSKPKPKITHRPEPVLPPPESPAPLFHRTPAGWVVNPNAKLKNIAGEDVSGYVQRLLAMFPGLTIPELTDIYQAQFRQYNEALIARGLGLSRQELTALDTIDMQAVAGKANHDYDVPDLNIADEISQQLDVFVKDPQLGFYRILPCFSKGVFRINTERYIYFEIQHIDFENEKFSVLLRDYAMLTNMGNIWQAGIYGIAEITYCNMADEYEIKAAESDSNLFFEIYQQISPKELGWNKIQRAAWKEIAVRNARETKARLKSMDTNNVVQIARLFMTYTTLSNFILENNKPKVAPGQKDKLEHNKSLSKKLKARAKEEQNTTGSIPAPALPEDIPEKIVRNIGLIRMISTKTPRVFSSKSIRNYKIPSWTTRGHTRTYKSGKKVYIQATTHHRKSLSNPENKTPQSVIKIVNNTGGEDLDS